MAGAFPGGAGRFASDLVVTSCRKRFRDLLESAAFAARMGRSRQDLSKALAARRVPLQALERGQLADVKAAAEGFVQG